MFNQLIAGITTLIAINNEWWKPAMMTHCQNMYSGTETHIVIILGCVRYLGVGFMTGCAVSC